MRRQHIERRRERAGVAAVEFALVVPLILLLVAGLVEVGRLVEIKQLLVSATREAGRVASTGQSTNAQVADAARAHLQAAGLSVDGVTVTIENLTQPGVDARDASQLDRIRIVVAIPWAEVRWLNINVTQNEGSEIRAQAVWPSVRDKPYPSPPEPPIE